VARSDKWYRKIYRQLWYISENKESDGDISEKAKVKWSSRETVDLFDGWLYNQVTVSSRKGYNLGSLQ